MLLLAAASWKIVQKVSRAVNREREMGQGKLFNEPQNVHDWYGRVCKGVEVGRQVIGIIRFRGCIYSHS